MSRSLSGLFTVLLLLGSSISACRIPGKIQHKIDVSLSTAMILNDIDSSLAARDAELRLRCRALECTIAIAENVTPKIEVEVINHPFKPQPLVLRIDGGTQTLQGALYEALGRHTQTKEVETNNKEILYQRELERENGKLRIRCTKTQQAPFQNECLIVVSATLIRGLQQDE